jgi:DNA-binding Lrp family transcriptional regulator
MKKKLKTLFPFFFLFLRVNVYKQKLRCCTTEIEMKSMNHAYVLLNVESKSEDQVLKDIRAVAGVQEAYVMYGVYDLVAKVEAASMTELKELVSQRLRMITNVKNTLTLIIIE